MRSYENNEIKKLYLWENLKYQRIVASKKKSKPSDADDSKDEEIFHLEEISNEFLEEYDVFEETQLIDWFIENKDGNPCEIVIVSNSTPEGDQFVRTSNGIGSILQYKVKNDYDDDSDDNENDFNEEDFI